MIGQDRQTVYAVHYSSPCQRVEFFLGVCTFWILFDREFIASNTKASQVRGRLGDNAKGYEPLLTDVLRLKRGLLAC